MKIKNCKVGMMVKIKNSYVEDVENVGNTKGFDLSQPVKIVETDDNSDCLVCHKDIDGHGGWPWKEQPNSNNWFIPAKYLKMVKSDKALKDGDE